MAKIVTSIMLAFILLSCLPALGSQAARPYTGIGLLIIRPMPTMDPPAERTPVIFYEDPGIRRVAELNAIDIPMLFPESRDSGKAYVIAVTGIKGKWLRIAYDDAGREGWVRMERFWRFTPWHSFLTGRSAALVPQLRETAYILRKGCSDTSAPVASLSAGQVFKVMDVDGDWIRIQSGTSSSGYVKWRGNDGRIMISPDWASP
jgi:hypothetical protein